jgi:Zn-dependent protease with chaperone function
VKLAYLALVALLSATTSVHKSARAQSPAQNPSPTVQQSPSAPGSPVASVATPAPITSYTLPPKLYPKARNRGRISFATRVFAIFYGLAVLWFILRSKLSARFRDWAERTSRFRFIQSFLFVAPLVLAIAILELPLGVFRESVLKLYAISVQPWPSWLADWAKTQSITIIFGGFLAWILFAVIRKSPTRWWFYFWLIALPILLFTIFISPYVIDPLFNKYEPLASKAPALVPELQRITRRAGMEVPPERMFWMKASDKTVGTNASVNGFGASKRIIIWDTTLAQETTDEVLMDFGHEMGHYALNHIWKGFLFIAALLLALLYLGYRTIGSLLTRHRPRWGIRGLDDWAALPAILLLFSIFNFGAAAIGNTFSRHQEAEADLYSMEVAHGLVPDPGQAAASSFQKYGELVLDDPTPNPIRVFLFYDHPTTADRIRFFVTYDPWSHNQPRRFIQ